MQSTYLHRNRAFTLVELLVVIGIIAVLVAILLLIAAFPFFLREKPGDLLLPSRTAAANHISWRGPAADTKEALAFDPRPIE